MKKRNRILMIVVCLICLVCVFGLTACNKDLGERFGMFSVGGKYLISLGKNKIEAAAAKALLRVKNGIFADAMEVADVEGGSEVIEGEPNRDYSNLVSKYSSIEVSIDLWDANKKGELEKVNKLHIYSGQQLKDTLKNNRVFLESSIDVAYLICNDQYIEFFEKINEEFKLQDSYELSPFKQVFTYLETDPKKENKCFVLQVHTYKDLDNFYGGVAARFIQECEYKFDEEGKITNFQSSLGITINNPDSSLQFNGGRNVEIAFTWKEKV